jgi:1,4-dihydroxy-6-naphthoate synthase
MRIRLGHSPDPDDAFMFWALTTDLVATRGLEFEQVLQDIQTLNRWALDGRLEVTAISLATYPLVQERYALLPHGASIGSGYGPVVVAREPLDVEDLRGREILVPGAMTTAFLTLRMALHRVLDLGEWWLLETGLPLPLGVNVARRDLGDERLGDIAVVLAEAIQCGLDHRAEALEYALQFGRGIDAAVADRFVSMYVNELTQDYGDEGRKAVLELLRRGESIGAWPAGVRVDFVAA